MWWVYGNERSRQLWSQIPSRHRKILVSRAALREDESQWFGKIRNFFFVQSGASTNKIAKLSHVEKKIVYSLSKFSVYFSPCFDLSRIFFWFFYLEVGTPKLGSCASRTENSDEVTIMIFLPDWFSNLNFFDVSLVLPLPLCDIRHRCRRGKPLLALLIVVVVQVCRIRITVRWANFGHRGVTLHAVSSFRMIHNRVICSSRVIPIYSTTCIIKVHILNIYLHAKGRL